MDRSKEKNKIPRNKICLALSGTMFPHLYGSCTGKRRRARPSECHKLFLPCIWGLSPGCLQTFDYLPEFLCGWFWKFLPGFCCSLGDTGSWRFMLHHFHWHPCVLNFSFNGSVEEIFFPFMMPKCSAGCTKSLNYRPILSTTMSKIFVCFNGKCVIYTISFQVIRF